MAGPTDLFLNAEDVLQAAVDSLNEIPAPLAGAPDRAFVSPGVPIDDCCEQLTVHVNPVAEAPTSPQGALEAGRRTRVAWLNVVTFTITIGRCVPVPDQKGNRITLPPAADQQAAAEQIQADGWALWNGLHNRVQAHDLFDNCPNVTFGPLTARTQSGGCGGWTLDLNVIVPGYRPANGS